MNPDTGDEAEDWFAKFEREAREAARTREQTGGTPDGAPDGAGAEEPVAPPRTAAPAEPPSPQIPNPFDGPVTPPPPSVGDPAPTHALGRVEPEPTQAMPIQAHDTPASGVPARADDPTQAIVPASLIPPTDESGSPLDALFSDERFREYEAGPDPSEAPFAKRARSKELVHVPGLGTPPPPRFGTPQKVLAGVGAGLLAVIALIGLFVLGTRLPDLLGPAPAVVTASPTPTPTITALPVGPVEPGEYEWDELLGGECLEPYADAWQDDYTVVDCAEAHGGQMVYRAWFPPLVVDPENPQVGKPGDPFPGVDALQAQISLLCSAPGVVDLAAAGGYSDIQVQGSYPVTREQWDEDPSYYCFVSRSSGEPLTGSVAIPRTAAEPVAP